MPTLTYFKLGEPGLAYVRERLWGGKTLSHLLLARLALHQGAAWTYLPAGLPESAIFHIDEGIMGTYRAIVGAERAPRPKDIRPDAGLDHIVLRFLDTFPTGIVLREDALASASDPVVRRRPPEEPVVFVDEEVYGVAHAGTATAQTLHVALESLQAWQGEPVVLAVLPEPDLRPFVRPGATIAREALEPLVEHLQLLAFLAYDAEAYVYWSPPQSLVDTTLPPQTIP